MVKGPNPRAFVPSHRPLQASSIAGRGCGVLRLAQTSLSPDGQALRLGVTELDLISQTFDERQAETAMPFGPILILASSSHRGHVLWIETMALIDHGHDHMVPMVLKRAAVPAALRASMAGRIAAQLPDHDLCLIDILTVSLAVLEHSPCHTPADAHAFIFFRQFY